MLKDRFIQILNGKTKTSKKMILNIILLSILSMIILPGIISCNKITHRVDSEKSSLASNEQSLDEYIDDSNIFDMIPVLSFPVPNGYVTKKYGPQIGPISGEWFLHKGIDIGYGMGAPIIAATGGTVIEKGYEERGFGNYLLIQHDDGFITKYAHMQNIYAKDGQEYKQGDVIGTMGDSGLSDGPHLHFEIRIGDQVIDPFALFNHQEKKTNTVSISIK